MLLFFLRMRGRGRSLSTRLCSAPARARKAHCGLEIRIGFVLSADGMRPVASPWRRGGAPPFLEGFSCSHAGAVHGGGRSLRDCLGLLRRLRWVWVYLLAALPCFHVYVVYGGGRVGLLVLFQPAVASAWVHWELLARGVTGSTCRRRSATHHASSCPPPTRPV